LVPRGRPAVFFFAACNCTTMHLFEGARAEEFCRVACPRHLSTDPYLWLTDPDSGPAPDPAIFVSDLQDYFLLLFKATSHKGIFLTIFASWEKDREPDPYPVLTTPDPGGPKQRIIRLRIRYTGFLFQFSYMYIRQIIIGESEVNDIFEMDASL
jgi:hypothetical protein